MINPANSRNRGTSLVYLVFVVCLLAGMVSMGDLVSAELDAADIDVRMFEDYVRGRVLAFSSIFISSSNQLALLSRVNQIKRWKDYVFIVKVYHGK